MDISDAIWTLNYLFVGGVQMRCRNAADANDSGVVDIFDAIFTLAFLFTSSGRPFPPPYPSPGIDPTEDAPDCVQYPNRPQPHPPSPGLRPPSPTEGAGTG